MANKRRFGFSLIELLIAVAILGILAGIAVPSYSSYITKSRRVDAQIGLHNAAQKMERCRSQTFTYVGCTGNVPTTSPEGYYTIAFNDTVTATQFTATATPVSGKSQGNDTKCASMTIDHTGATASRADDTTTVTTDDCW